MMNQDTICAIATAQGGAIGSIRVSGPEAISITSLIFKPAKPDKLFSDQKPYSLTFGRIYDGDEIIDEVLVSLFVRLIPTREKIARKLLVMVLLTFFNRCCNC